MNSRWLSRACAKRKNCYCCLRFQRSFWKVTTNKKNYNNNVVVNDDDNLYQNNDDKSQKSSASLFQRTLQTEHWNIGTLKCRHEWHYCCRPFCQKMTVEIKSNKQVLYLIFLLFYFIFKLPKYKLNPLVLPFTICFKKFSFFFLFLIFLVFL